MTELTSNLAGLSSVGASRAGPVSPTSAATARLQPLGLGEVVLAPVSFLGSWQERNSTRTIPHCISQLHSTGALANLEAVAAGHVRDFPHAGLHFSDSDVYKVLEAIAWDSARGLEPEVSGFADRACELVGRAQRQDGYVNSWFQGQEPELVWQDLRWGHELYCCGHLLQAAVANERSASPGRLRGVSARLVEHLLTTFSLDDGDGRLVGVGGHPEIETALVEYYRTTGDDRALALAKRQVDLRGRPDVRLPAAGAHGDSRFPLSYFLHHMPVRRRSTATGHAVRELYLQAGVVDVATETHDAELLAASESIWDDLFTTKTYVTGGHGSRHRDESIGDSYELPSDRAYAETCAAIASFQWNWRLLLATGQARYAAAMEHVVMNTLAGAVSKGGTEFFYSNTLHLRTGHDGSDEDAPRHRLAWYRCPCCPPNLARLLASIQAYLMTRDEGGLQLQLPFSGDVSTAVPGGGTALRLSTGHPWEETTTVEIVACSSSKRWSLSMRAPDWAPRHGVEVTVNGTRVEATNDGDYVRVERVWTPGDRLRFSSPMPVRVLEAHPAVDAVRGCVALQRGPLVYCVETDDLEATSVEDFTLDRATVPEVSSDVPAGLEGYVEVAIKAGARRSDSGGVPLYSESRGHATCDAAVPVTLVPYFARGNRRSAAMRVWVPVAPGSQEAATPELD